MIRRRPIFVFFDERNPTIADLQTALFAIGEKIELRLAVARNPFPANRRRFIMLQVESIHRNKMPNSVVLQGITFPAGDGVGLEVSVVYDIVQRTGILSLL